LVVYKSILWNKQNAGVLLEFCRTHYNTRNYLNFTGFITTGGKV